MKADVKQRSASCCGRPSSDNRLLLKQMLGAEIHEQHGNPTAQHISVRVNYLKQLMYEHAIVIAPFTIIAPGAFRRCTEHGQSNNNRGVVTAR